MKLFVVSFIIAVAAAESLENTYLPPSTSKTASGNGDLLNARNGLNSKYGPPEYSNRNANNGNPQNTDSAAATLRFDNQNNGDGSYKFEFETENKIKHEESGELRNVGTEQEVTVVQGSYSYLGPDGVEYTVTYIADENGFQASGDHLPTSPPIPEEIQRSLEKNAADEAQEGYPSGPNSNQNYQDSQSIAYQRNQFVKESNQNDNESIIVESPENNVNNVQSQVYPTGKPPGRQPIPTTEEGKQYQPPQAPGRQYLTPNKPAFNAKSGYQY